MLCAGVGRSGTTALRLSLGLHPSIYYPGTENNILTGVLLAAMRNCTLPDRRVAMLVSQAEYDRAFEQLFNTLLWPQREQHRNQIQMAACDLREDIMDYLYRVFPNIRVVYLIRNGMQVVASRALFESMKHDAFEDHCALWLRAYKITQWGQDKPDKIRFFRYEWFHEPERLRGELANLFEWLGISWHDAPLKNLLTERYHPTQHPGEPDAGEANFARTRDERWKHWSEQERAVFETKCGEAMRALGYAIPWQT